MPDLVPVINQSAIEARVASLAKEISAAYAGRELVVVGILKGAFIFMADLVRRLAVPVQVDFIRTASYGMNAESSGKVRLLQDIELDITHKDVLVVEDIVDSGLTLKFIMDHIRTFNPGSVKVCALVDKPERREVDMKIDYVGHHVKEGFLVGYGLDYAEKYRCLPAIYHLKPNTEDRP